MKITLSVVLLSVAVSAGAAETSPRGTPGFCLPLYQEYKLSQDAQLRDRLLRQCRSWYQAVRLREARSGEC